MDTRPTLAASALLLVANAENERLNAENALLRTALEIIAGRRQCADNLMSNVDVAIAALDDASAMRAADVLRVGPPQGWTPDRSWQDGSNN